MSLEKSVCELVERYWGDLHPSSQAPDSLVFLKVAGKTSPNSSIISLILDARYQRPIAVAKIPRNPRLTVCLEHEYAAMVDIRNKISKPEILAHIPCNGTLAEVNGVKILLQTAGAGHPMVREMTSRQAIKSLYEKILPWMFDFHADGSEDCVLEGETLRELVEAPIAQFMEQFGFVSNGALSSQARQYLAELPRKVVGQKVRLCRQHGDFNAHNILVEFDGSRLNDFTLIDWEDYRPQQLPIHDLNHFFTSNSKVVGMGMLSEESYANLVLNDGWYRDLYVKAVAAYESHGLINRKMFWALTPIYFVMMCISMMKIQREQQDTIKTWVKRANAFIDRYCGGL